MSIAIITGSSGLVGSESVNFFSHKGFDVIGIDNNLRAKFFGKEGDTRWIKNDLIKFYKNYIHKNVDIRRDLVVHSSIDIAEAKEGFVSETGSVLVAKRGIEVGHVFKLGDAYTKKMNNSASKLTYNFVVFVHYILLFLWMFHL